MANALTLPRAREARQGSTIFSRVVTALRGYFARRKQKDLARRAFLHTPEGRQLRAELEALQASVLRGTQY